MPSQNKQPVSEERSEKPQITLEQAMAGGAGAILDYISPTQWEITPNWINMPGMYAATLFVYTYPRYLQTNWLSPIINYDITMDVSMFIYPQKSKHVMSGLTRKVTQLESTMTIEQEKGLVRDPELETAISDIEALRDVIQRGEVKLFQAALYFTIYAKTKEEIETISEQLDSTLGGMLIYTKPALLQMEPGFNSTLPLGKDELGVLRNLDTGSLSTTFPFTSVELTSSQGILYGINRHNNSLIIFDRFDLENANSVVFAKAGAGKSYAIKLEVLRSLMFGTDVLVIDPENEYQALCEAIGGVHINMSLNSNTYINPFDLAPPIAGERGEDTLREAIINVYGLVALMVGGVNPEESSILEQALYQVYALKDITPDVATHKNEPPLMTDLEQMLLNMQGGQSLALRMQRYTRGTFSGLFTKQTNISLENRFVVFSIRDLEEQLRPIAMYICLNYIWAQIRFKLKKRILVIDEAWWMMQYEDSARFLMGLAKRARKYYLGVTVITQDVEDFLSSRYGRAVINNSSMQLLLKQSPAAIDQIAEVFHLTEGEKYLLLESEIGEGLFFAGLKHVAIKVIASFTEDQIITTDPRQLLQLQAEVEAAKAPEQPLVAPTPYEQALVEGKPVPAVEKDQTRELFNRAKQEAGSNKQQEAGSTKPADAKAMADKQEAGSNKEHEAGSGMQDVQQPQTSNIPHPASSSAPTPSIPPQAIPASAGGQQSSVPAPQPTPPPSQPETTPPPVETSPPPQAPISAQPTAEAEEEKIVIDEGRPEETKPEPKQAQLTPVPKPNPYSLAEKRKEAGYEQPDDNKQLTDNREEIKETPIQKPEKSKMEFFYQTPPGLDKEQEAGKEREAGSRKPADAKAMADKQDVKTSNLPPQASRDSDDFWGEDKNGVLE